MHKKKYLITGGLGFIGSNIANQLDGDITILSRSDSKKDRIQKKGINFLIKDLRDLIKEDLAEIDVIYHCASTVHNYHILNDINIDIDTNLKGTIHMLELIKDLPKKPRIIFPSTFFVYGNQYVDSGEPIDENSKVDPLALYPITKFCAEQVIKLYSRLYDIPYNICRVTNVYGATENFNDPKKAWLNFFIMTAIKGKPANIYNGGNFLRDYIYVDDVVDAFMFVEKLEQNEIFLIGNGSPVKFKDMVGYILDHTSNKAKVGTIDPPEFHQVVGITDFVADTSKINKLGWQASINYEQGLQKIIDHYITLQT